MRIKVLPTLSSLPADRLKREELLASSQEERTEEGKVVLPSRLQELEVALAALAVLFAAPASSELNATLGLQTTFDEVDLIRFLFGW